MTHLKTCPECNHAAKQRGGAQSFVTCGGKCPISRLSIPIAAWQSWPRTPAGKKTTAAAEEATRRNEEITRLQNRLKKFGDIEQQNRTLEQQVERATLELQAEQRQTKVDTDRLYQLEQGLKKVTTERDKLVLQQNKIVKWATAGAKAEWILENDQRATVYEDALNLMGRLDAQNVPCRVCGHFPVAVSRLSKTTGNLSCGCRGADGRVQYFTAKQWCEKQREGLKARRDQSNQPDTGQYLRNIEAGRKFAISAGNVGPASTMMNMQADMNELTLMLVMAQQRQDAK